MALGLIRYNNYFTKRFTKVSEVKQFFVTKLKISFVDTKSANKIFVEHFKEIGWSVETCLRIINRLFSESHYGAFDSSDEVMF